MKALILLMITVGFMMISCGQQEDANVEQTDNVENPFFAEYDTPFGVPAFDKIKNEHFLPAFKKAIEENRYEIDDIANSEEDPTFENTIVAMEITGKLLDKVSNVFYNLTSAHTNDDIKAKLIERIAPG